MNWANKKIVELGRVVTGKTPSTSNPEFFDGEYPFVTPSDIDYANYYCHRTERTVTDSARERHANQFVPKDAVMFTCIGNTIGKCAIAPSDSLTNQQINSVVANKYTDAKFIYYLLCNNIASIRPLGGGSATPIINKTDFEGIEFRVPPHDVQKQIGEFLSTYDDLIENNRRRMALLEESARLLYREWFVRLRFPGYEHTCITDGVPEGWGQVRVDDFGTVLTGKTPATKDSDNYGGDIPFVKTPDMHGHTFVLQSEAYLTEKGAKSQANKFLPPGALLVSCIGTVGVVSLTSETCQFNQQINAVIPNEDFLRYYCYFAFKDMKPRLEAIGGGVTMANVSKGKFESMDLLRPSASLLRNFDEFCTPVFSQIKVLGQQNQKLRAARDLLLPRLMSGEIVT